jgi:hypothetical protein
MLERSQIALRTGGQGAAAGTMLTKNGKLDIFSNALMLFVFLSECIYRLIMESNPEIAAKFSNYNAFVF